METLRVIMRTAFFELRETHHMQPEIVFKHILKFFSNTARLTEGTASFLVYSFHRAAPSLPLPQGEAY